MPPLPHIVSAESSSDIVIDNLVVARDGIVTDTQEKSVNIANNGKGKEIIIEKSSSEEEKKKS